MKKSFQVIFACLFSTISLFSFADQLNKPKEIHEQIEPISLVNINLADQEALTSLKGVGLKKAEAIIEYRLTVGKFVNVNDLLKVNGIGAHVLAQNKARLTL